MRFKFKVLFWAGISLFLVVCAFASWGLFELRSVMAVRRQASSMQSSLHSILESLQEADIAFIMSKPKTQEQDVRTVVSLVSRAHKRAVLLTKMDVFNGQIHKEIDELEVLIRGKVRTEDEYLVTGGISDEPVFKKVTTMRDNLVLTDVVQDKISKLDHLLQEFLFKHQGYVDRYFTLSLVAISLGVGLAFGLFLLFGRFVSREIDRRSKLEVELRMAQEAAIAASALKSQFLATVSHEVRTPLNGIIGMSELIRDKAEGELKKYAGVIHESGRSLLRIVNDILDFSRIEANRMEFELQEVKFSSLFEMAIELFSTRANDKKIQLMAHYDPRFASYFAADGARISQVLHNLIGNAIKFTSKGYVQITGQVLGVEGSELRVRMSVEDTGVGIATDKTGEIFQPFNQAAAEHQREGTGLGLSISKRLIEMMGGTIHFSTTFGTGSRFWIDLPVRSLRQAEPLGAHKFELYSYLLSPPLTKALGEYARALHVKFHVIETASALPQGKNDIFLACGLEVARGLNADLQKHALVIDFPAVATPYAWRTLTLPLTFDRFIKTVDADTAVEERGATPSPSQALVQRGNGLILLVEDNATNQILAQTQLEQLGYRVHLAENGLECLAAMRRTNYDLILMDCRMPVMDGFAASEQIRERERQRQSARVPIIAITANALEVDRNRCLASGMDDYIAKPFDLKTLHALIQKWCAADRTEIDWRVVSDLANRTNNEVVTRLLHSFQNTLHTSLERISQCLERTEWKEISNLAHQLKSSAAAVGAVKLSHLCAQIEDEIETNKVAEVSLCEQLLGVGQRVLEELSAQSRYA